MLRFVDVIKSFGATRALKGVSLDVRRGGMVSLLGEDGAGKSTLIEVPGGPFRTDGGEILVDDVPCRHRVRGGGRSPVTFIHQDLGPVEWMTVAENIGLAGRRRFGIDRRGTAARARDASERVGCDFDPETRVSSLGRTERSLVAIARAIAVDCDHLVLDAPIAGLPADEVDRLFEAMRRLKARGVGMIYMSQRLDEGFRIAVMRDGAKVGGGGPRAVRRRSAPRAGAARRPRARPVVAASRARDRDRVHGARPGRESICPSLSVSENCFLDLGAAGRGALSALSPARAARDAAALGVPVGLRPGDPALAVEGLSGGNRHEVVVGRWLATQRRLLDTEDPTAGPTSAPRPASTGSSRRLWSPASPS